MAASQPDWSQHVDVQEMIAELTRPHSHREHYTTRVGATTWGRDHVTKVPPLIDQLQHASPSGEGLGRGGGYESRPVARVEALDVLTWIDDEAARWVRRLGEDDPGFTGRCVTLLGSLLPAQRHCGQRRPKSPGCCTRHSIEADVRRWWTQARIVTGWDTAPWRPDNTCPHCGKRGGLRIRLEQRVGMCVECRESWDPSSYQQLGEHIRAESETARRAVAGPCWCPWPLEPIEGAAALYAMCPRCGSARCRHAVRLVKHRYAS